MLLGGAMRGTGLGDVTMMIMDTFMTAMRKVDIVLVGHGGPGAIQLGGADLLDGATKANFAAAVRGKVNMLTLFGCCVASGTGPAFLQMLADMTGAQVKAYMGKIGVAKGIDGVMDGFYVEGGATSLKTFNPVPEPATWLAVAMAVALILAFRR